MNFLRKIFKLTFREFNCETAMKCILTEKQASEIEKKSGLKEKIISEIDEIEERRIRAESKIDELEATIDGDPKWFLMIERRRNVRPL